ncbi:MAG: hypothetical protein EOM25_11305 [Deltaproteobacteria bacterium]|nr:hypothetical protein [Deltaproteobacteria bacterium]
MFCKKCKYHSSDHLNACPKCGQDWQSIRERLNLAWVRESNFLWLGAKAGQGAVEQDGFLFEDAAAEAGNTTAEAAMGAGPDAFDAVTDDMDEHLEPTILDDEDLSGGEALPADETALEGLDIDLDALLGSLEEEQQKTEDPAVVEEQTLQGLEVPGLEDLLEDADLDPISTGGGMPPKAPEPSGPKVEKLDFISLDDLPLETSVDEPGKAVIEPAAATPEPAFVDLEEVGDIDDLEIDPALLKTTSEPEIIQKDAVSVPAEDDGNLLDVLELSFDEDDEALLSDLGLSEKDLREAMDKAQPAKKK